MGKQLHIVMFSWFAMGHMIPFLHLTNKLVERGHKTTFLLPKKAILLLASLNLHPTLNTLHPITIPHVDPLPPGSETTSDIPIHLTNHLATTMDLTCPEIEPIIMSLESKPNLLFYDMAHWVPEIASKLSGVQIVCYKVICVASLTIAIVPARGLSRDKPITASNLCKAIKSVMDRESEL